ncbi:GPP34 family phosphoprotein [bacterium]|nr:GPP34 family phosphoprotein [bacterium]
MRHDLTIYEEAMLLSLHDEKGTALSTWHTQAVAGGLLAELLLEGRIAVGPAPRHLVWVADGGATGSDLMDEALAKMAAGRQKPLREWLAALASIPRLGQRVAEGLCDEGILRAKEGKILWFFPTTSYPEADGRPETAILKRLRKAISGVKEVDPRTTVLLGLAHHTELLRGLFPARLLKLRRKRIKEIINGDAASGATREAIQAVQTAIMVTVMMPIIFSSASN